MKNIFTKHPHSVNETYMQHLFFASGFGFRMMFGGLACLIHAVFPFLFIKTASNQLLKMTHNFVKRMPRMEGHVIHIYEMIDDKLKNTTSG